MSFTATKWDTAEDKEKFLKQLQRFAQRGFPEASFNKTFYRRLSQMLGHIAHYDAGGFYDCWFAVSAKQLAWMDHVLTYPCTGDPAWTWSDVEAAFKGWLAASDLYPKLRAQVEQDGRNGRQALYLKLKAEFEPAKQEDANAQAAATD